MAKKATVDVSNRVELKIPRQATKDEDPNLFISINGVNYLLPKGKTSLVPPAVAKEYYRSERAKDKFYATRDAKLAESKFN